MKTWHFEMAVAALLLGAAAAVRGTWVDWVGALAVLLSFGHACVAERMRERQEQGSHAFVDCHRALNLYLVGKEIAWVVFFVATSSYPALVGCALFLLYPVWRSVWRTHHPLEAR